MKISVGLTRPTTIRDLARMFRGVAGGALLAVACTGAAPGMLAADPGLGLPPNLNPGLVVLARHRFDPAVQRLIAEHSLKALPLEDGQLYYLYPIRIDPRLEEMQIRYLEQLLEKRARSEPDPE